MKSTLKDNQLFLFNAYSKTNSTENFISGSDRVGLELIKQSSQKIYVFAPKSFESLIPKNCIFISTQSKQFNSLLLNYFYRTLNTIKLLKDLNIDGAAIISTSDFFCDTIPAAIFSNKYKWYAFTYHLYPSIFKVKSLRNLFGNLAQFISFCLFKKAGLILTTNSISLSFLTKFFSILNIKKINLGLNYELFLNSNSIRPIDLIYVGRIKETKGIFELPEIAFNLKKYFPNLKIEVIGNGSSHDLQFLKNLILKFDVSDVVRINTNLNDNQLREHLCASKFLIQLSREEGFGLVILEALASGCQVIGYKLPVYGENFLEFNLDMVQDFKQKDLNLLIVERLKDYQYKDTHKDDFINYEWKSIYNSIFNN